MLYHVCFIFLFCLHVVNQLIPGNPSALLVEVFVFINYDPFEIYEAAGIASRYAA